MTIKEICQKYNLGQTALSRRFGIPLRTVQQWYAGDRNPPPYVVDMITWILDQETEARQLLEAFEAAKADGSLPALPEELDSQCRAFIEKYIERK